MATKTKAATTSTDDSKTGIQHFDGTISKIDNQGRLVASSYVNYDEGEKLTADLDAEEISAAQVKTTEVAAQELADANSANDGGDNSSDSTSTASGSSSSSSSSNSGDESNSSVVKDPADV
jgi:hypothetical protein